MTKRYDVRMNNMNVGVVEQLIDYLEGKRPEHLVNADIYESHRQ